MARRLADGIAGLHARLSLGRASTGLTERALDLYPVIVGLMRWAERHLGDARDVPALEPVHRSCGRPAEPYLACAAGHEPLTARDVEVALRH